MRVLVIAEDFRKDQYVLQPIIGAMLKFIGRSTAVVEVCRDPLLGAVTEALKWGRIESILRRYPMADLFLLCVDRDGNDGRESRLRDLERQSTGVLRPNQLLLAVDAWQETEVWVLAGLLDLPGEWSWRDICAERDPKEVYFEPLARSRNLIGLPDNGRGVLAREAAKRYERIRQLCPEDARYLDEQVSAWLKSRA